MIVISGALVVVAAVLLVAGLATSGLTLVYCSIGVSIVSAVFLALGVLQRRGEQPAAEAAAPTGGAAPVPTGAGSTPAAPPAAAPAAGPVAVAPAAAADRDADTTTLPPVEDDEYDDVVEETGGTVYVVEGRPRYHVAGCRYLTGKDAEELDVLDARDEGFTACGVCKPDQALVEVAQDLEEAEPAPLLSDDGIEELADDDAASEETVDDVPGRRRAAVAAAPTTAPATATAPTTGRGTRSTARATTAATSAATTSAATTSAAAKAPAKTAAAKAAAPAKASRAAKAPVKASGASAAPAKTSGGATRTAATTRTPAPEPVRSLKRGGVLVIPDRGKFHQPDCRYVRGNDEAVETTRAAATRQGYAACGVCKP